MLSFLQKTIRVFLIFTPIIVLGWLAANEINLGGRMEAVYDTRHDSPFISKLYPKDRVSDIQFDADNEPYRTFLDEPVYFDLNPIGSFEQVAVTVEYRNANVKPFKFGGLGSVESWSFDFRDLPPTKGALQTTTEIFDFKKLAPEGKKFRFVFSAPGIPSGDIEIYKIKALFLRPPLTEQDAANKILEALTSRLNKIFGHK
jgi:hypothetical protein